MADDEAKTNRCTALSRAAVRSAYVPSTFQQRVGPRWFAERTLDGGNRGEVVDHVRRTTDAPHPVDIGNLGMMELDLLDDRGEVPRPMERSSTTVTCAAKLSPTSRSTSLEPKIPPLRLLRYDWSSYGEFKWASEQLERSLDNLISRRIASSRDLATSPRTAPTA